VVSTKRIVPASPSVIEQTADRIYEILYKVVHTKNLEGGDGHEMILPFSDEEDSLVGDVELIQFWAQRVLIAASAPLSL
jgi:hypothetical protein